MLLAAIALLSASMRSLGVIESPPVPAETRSASIVTERDVADPLATLAAVAHRSSHLARRRDAEEEAEAMRGRTPRVVASEWAALSGSQRAHLVRDAPALVGDLDGVPYHVRDRANRAVLAQRLGDPNTSAKDRSMLEHVREALTTVPDGPPKYLILLGTEGSGRSAIAVGDLDTATNVTVMVPGMFFTVSGQLADWTATAGDLYREQATQGVSGGTAVVAWMGYRTPDLTNVFSLGLARQGARRLTTTLEGIRTVRSENEPRLNVVAHSYGSTTALMALGRGNVHVNSLTLLGCPGSTVATSAALSVDTGQVFVGAAYADPVAGLAYFGVDPGAASFGARRLDLVDVRDRGAVFVQPIGHNAYLKPGTVSLHDVALITLGRGALARVFDDAPTGNGSSISVPRFVALRVQELQPRD